MAIWHRVKNIFFGIAIGQTLTDTFGTVARVEGISMQPTLNPTFSTSSDMVFLSYLPVYFDSIKRGDIIVAISPRNPDETIVKRVIGIEGDIVKIKRKKDDHSTPKVVPKGYYWIEGDHKGHTYDSTSFGPISKGLIVAKVPAIVWPPSRWQLMQSKLHELGNKHSEYM